MMQDERIDQLKRTIAELEAQRSTLGDEVVETALAPLKLRLDELLRPRKAPIPPSPETLSEQRKLVSVLCADLVDFTALSTQLDPEELREVQQAYIRAVTPSIINHGGMVEKYIGDMVLAVFGLPQTREDDPEQTVRTALEMQSALQELNASHKNEVGFPLQMRLGIHTGVVLATLDPAGGDFVVTGEAVNLASRLQNLAPAGGVLISHDTYRYVRGAFDVQVLEPIQVKGMADPVISYRVLRAKPRTFRQLVREVEGIETPLVGRQAELKYLQDALLGILEEGEGQVVTVQGEAGVGKSRLLDEFQNWLELRPERMRLFLGRARQEAQGLPYGLLRDLFANRFTIQEDDQVEDIRVKVEAGFGEVFGGGIEGQVRVHLLGQLLGYDFSLSPHLKGVANEPEQLRNRGMMYLVEYFKGICDLRPVVVFLEDLHWADDSSLDVINRLGEVVPHLRMLIVGAARHTLLERRPFWGEGLPYHHFIEIQPLSKRESRQLVGEILRLVDAVPPQLRELVVEGGEGNPYYIEELIKMLIENGVIVKGERQWQVEIDRLEQLTVPPTLAGVLQARLDGLPEQERIVLQQASVVGRLFWDRVVAYIHAAQEGEGGEEVVPTALTALRGRELIYRHEESAFSDAREYLFKHDLLREVTYESVLKRLRKGYHSLAADWLVAHSGERLGEYRGLIAEHYLLAGRKEQALEHLAAAGQAALAAYANPEAEGYFLHALELDPQDFQKAGLLGGLGEALRRQARREETYRVFRDGIKLYHRSGDLNRAAYLFASLSLALWETDYAAAWQTCQEGLALLEGAPDSPGLARLLAEAGRTAYFKSEPAERVEALCQRAIRMAEKFGEVIYQAEALITMALQTRDSMKAIQMMEQALTLVEALAPCNTAARGHTDLGAISYLFFVDLNAGLQHRLESVEIYRQIGDLDGIFLGLEGATQLFFEKGEFNYHNVIKTELLTRNNAFKEQIEELLEKDTFINSCLLFHRGEWNQALDQLRITLENLRKGGKIQYIAECNLYLLWSLLELNYFAGLEDLSKAEAALKEIVEIGGWDRKEIPFHMVMVHARQGRLAEAHAQLSEAVAAMGQPVNNRQKYLRYTADAELALAERRWGEAVLPCQSLIEIFQSEGFYWRWARELIRLGDAVHQRNYAGDQEDARKAYRQSLEMFTEMGARGYIQVLTSRLQDLY